MPQFSYANFSEEAREAVLVAADRALGAGSKVVRPEHMKEAVEGATRSSRTEKELGEIPFDLILVHALNDAHDEAVAAGRRVELRDLKKKLR
jgi:hypothetical protein